MSYNYHVLLLGGKDSGKSTLLSRVFSRKGIVAFNQNLGSTKGRSIHLISISPLDRVIGFIDTPGAAIEESCAFGYVNAYVFCIDLSSSTPAAEQVAAFNSRMKEVKLIGGILIFVGTKADLITRTVDPELSALASQHGAQYFITSATNDTHTGDQALIAHLVSLANQHFDTREAAEAPGREMSPMQKAIDRLPDGNPLRTSLSNLYKEMKTLDPKKRAIIEGASNTLVTILHTSLYVNINRTIEIYEKICHNALKQSTGEKILNAVLAVACAAVATVIAAAIGFGIGFACGAWLGPGAFITAVLGAASAATVAVAAVSGAIGVAAGIGAGHRLFQPSADSKLVDKVVKDARETYKSSAA